MLSGTVLFCETSADEIAAENAREYIRENGYTQEQLKIVRNANEDITKVVWR